MNIHIGPKLRSDPTPAPHDSEAPIRSSLSSHDDLRLLGARLAGGSRIHLEGLQPFEPRERTKENAERIRAVVHTLDRAQQAGESVTPAANWLLDNSHVVEEAIVGIHRDLPPQFYRQLPLMPDLGVPRVLVIAWAYVAHTDSAVSEDGFHAIVEGFQEEQKLRIGELWALPSILRFVLVENLRRLAVRVARARTMRLAANETADRLATAPAGAEAEILAAHAGHARDRTFATQLLHRLRDGSQTSHAALAWLEAALEAAGTNAEEITAYEHANLSAVWFEEVSGIDRILRERTDFAALDFPSRDAYRRAIEELAKRSGRQEHEVALLAVEMAGTADDGAAAEAGRLVDVGCVLVGPRRRELERAIGYRPSFGERLHRAVRKSGWLGVVVPVVLLAALFVTAIVYALAATGLDAGAIALLAVLFVAPALEAAVGLYNTLVSALVKPTRLIGYEYRDGVPAEGRTFVVVPTLIGSRDDIEDAVRNLEVHYLANMSGELHFAILSDWPDSETEESRADRDLLAHARKEIAALNARYPKEGHARFFLLHRRRLYNEAEGCWMGWERKRGKLHELNALLRGDRDTTFLPPSDPLPQDVEYVLTLDADTRTMRDAAARLVGKLAHPLNRPATDPKTGRLTAGYGILQPRVTPSLTTGDEASFFQRVFSANRGIDPYVFAVSDVYQDLFGEGTFTGKGLYHIDAMEAALKGRIPENTVLSHDLLEGSYAHAALVSDVELIEDYPTRYLVDASRHHRWARGDWQLLPWIFNPASGISGLSRWKMIDNLRRSLTPILWVAASVAGWTLLPFSYAAQWQALLILSLFLSLTFSLMESFVPRDGRSTLSSHFAAFGRDAAFATAQVVAKVVLMAHQAWSMGDAIARTLYRLAVSRRRMLEWRTASAAARAGDRDLAGHWRAMRGVLPVALAGLAIPLAAGSTGSVVALIFALLWATSPAFAWFISLSAETEDRIEVSPEDATALRHVARRTWLYFETFVTAEHNMLPPDNYQEAPEPVVAGRTSPTNIGVYLLSAVSARDFGWISLAETIDRLEKTLTTMEKMERYRGHLFNWYDTRTLKPLHPLYISSVDSGNLAGHLVAVAAACDEWASAPAAYLQGDFEGILDPTAILAETLDALPDDRRPLRPLRRRLAERIEGIRRAVATIRGEPETASIRAFNLTVLAADIRKLAKALDDEIRTPASGDLMLWAERLEKACEAHLTDAHMEENGVGRLRGRLVSLRDRARKFAFEMDFAFLMRQDRKLLSIGYRAEEHQLDEACYDLLASEARLTSLFAIAKGDLPTEHWFKLGRPVTAIGFSGALMSWSGSMFEYLMPPLVMKEPRGGILDHTSHLVIRRQMAYARMKGVPWGISEAAYNARDREMTYQYTNFGVPGLGLKRGLGQDTVIAPYASLLAAQFRPADAVANLERLKALGALGRYGFHDAVDFTPARLPLGKTNAVVRNFMAHHHGMSIVAAANAVFEGRMRERFHSDPVIVAAELLLQEKAPRTVPTMPIRVDAGERIKPAFADDRPDSRLIQDPLTAPHAINVMSNGYYNVMVTATGAGYSRAGEIAVTRWSGDPTEERSGTFLFVTDTDTGEWWSATAEPKRAPGEIGHAFFCDDKATFTKTVGTLHTEVECIVLSEGNGEARRITLWNESERDRYVEVTSFAEVALAFDAADQSHPAFSKMFVKTEIDGGGAMLFAERRRRADGEPAIALAHFVTSGTGVAREIEAETDRRAFIGRGRSLADAAAFDRHARLSGAAGFTLDPVMALRAKVRVPARKKVSLTFWTVVAANRADVEAEARRFTQPESYQRQAMLAWTRSQVQTRHVGLSLAEAAGVQKLARHLIFPDPALRAPDETIAAGLGRQSALWPTSISGDFPIFAVRIGDVADLEIVASALRMQEYLRARGLVFDLVVVNEQLRRAPRPDGRHDLPHADRGGADRPSHPQRSDPRPDRARRGDRDHARRNPSAGSDGAGRPSPPPAAGRQRPSLLERLRRLQRGRQRICRAAFGRPGDAAAVDQRHRQCRVRLPHLVGRRLLHLEPQQPRLPAHAVVERPGRQPAGRRHLSARPRHGRGVLAAGRHAARPGGALRGAARARRVLLHGEARRADRDADADRRSGRPGEGGRAADREPRRADGAAARLRLCRMGARQQPQPHHRHHRAGARRGERGAPRLQPLPSRFRRPHRLPRLRRGEAGLHLRPGRVPRGRRLHRHAGGRPQGCTALRPAGSRARPVRRPFLRCRDRAGRHGRAACRARRRGLAAGGGDAGAQASRGRLPRPARGQSRGMGGIFRRASGRHAGPGLRRHGQCLAALSGARLPHPRPRRLLSGERRLRLPRPAAGHAGADRPRRLARPRPDPQRRRPPVPGRRRAALVAAEERRRRAHHDLGRRGLARLCRAPLREDHRRPLDPRRGGAFHPRRSAEGGRARRLLHAGDGARGGQPLRALRPRARPRRPPHRRQRPAAHPRRRLERRHEPRRREGPRHQRLARLVPRQDAARLRRHRRGARRRDAGVRMARPCRAAEGSARDRRMGRGMVSARHL